jgi:hypothetical protein
MMGVPVPPRALSRHDGQTSYSTLTTIAESPLDAKLLYTGSDDGQVHVTRDGGQKWTNLTARIGGLPPGTYVSSVLASRHAAGRVYATFDGHYNDDYAAYAYVSDDHGQTWRSITAGLPATSVHRLREHPRNARLLFLGHERGIHLSIDGGGNWSSLNLNMPAVPVHDILIHPRDNNIASLEALTPEAVATEAFLVPPTRARLLSIYTPQAWYGAGQHFAPNPDFGAAIEYYLRSGTQSVVTVTLADARGHAVRTIKTVGRGGLNRVPWDLRLEPPGADGARDTLAGGGSGGASLGPLVLPGVYTVTVHVPGVTASPLSGELRVEPDPRVSFSEADRRVRQTLLMKLYELQKSLISARRMAVGFRSGADTQLANLHADITSELNTAAALSRTIEGYSGLPTTDQRRQIDWLIDDASKTLDAVQRVSRTDAPARRR